MRRLRTAPLPFTQDELLVLKVMKSLQITTREAWEALPEPDRLDWLAEEWHRQQRVKAIYDAIVTRRVENDKPIELTAVAVLALAQMM